MRASMAACSQRRPASSGDHAAAPEHVRRATKRNAQHNALAQHTLTRCPRIFALGAAINIQRAPTRIIRRRPHLARAAVATVGRRTNYYSLLFRSTEGVYKGTNVCLCSCRLVRHWDRFALPTVSTYRPLRRASNSHSLSRARHSPRCELHLPTPSPHSPPLFSSPHSHLPRSHTLPRDQTLVLLPRVKPPAPLRSPAISVHHYITLPSFPLFVVLPPTPLWMDSPPHEYSLASITSKACTVSYQQLRQILTALPNKVRTTIPHTPSLPASTSPPITSANKQNTPLTTG